MGQAVGSRARPDSPVDDRGLPAGVSHRVGTLLPTPGRGEVGKGRGRRGEGQGNGSVRQALRRFGPGRTTAVGGQNRGKAMLYAGLVWIGLGAAGLSDYHRPLTEKAFDQAALEAESFGEKKALVREASGLRVTLK